MQIRKQLPAHARVDQLKQEAKALLAELRAGSAEALERIRASHPRAPKHLALAGAQLVIAREYGFESWAKLRDRIEAIDLDDPATALAYAVRAQQQSEWITERSTRLIKKLLVAGARPEAVPGGLEALLP